MEINTLNTITLGALSGTVGAAVTLITSLISNYYSEKRKYKAENDKFVFQRKIEIGEHFYFLAGLKLQSYTLTVELIRNLSKYKSEEARKHLNDMLEDSKKEFDESVKTYNKHNFTHLYYPIKISWSDVASDDITTGHLIAQTIELTHQFNGTQNAFEKRKLSADYDKLALKLGLHLEKAANELLADMSVVKSIIEKHTIK